MSTPYLEACLQTKLHVVLNFQQHVCRNGLADFLNTISYSSKLFGHLYSEISSHFSGPASSTVLPDQCI
jgi:hypothetical protein